MGKDGEIKVFPGWAGATKTLKLLLGIARVSLTCHQTHHPKAADRALEQSTTKESG